MAKPDEQPASKLDEPVAETQIQLSEMPQTDDHSQVVILNNSESKTSHTPIRTVNVFAIVSLTIRVVTWLSLLASLIVLASNTSHIIVTVTDFRKEISIGFNDIYAYRYMMSAIVIGFAYTCVQVAFEIYQLATGKSLTKGNWLPEIIFYGDKFLLSFLATGVGAAFGATHDLKMKLDKVDDFLNPPYVSDYIDLPDDDLSSISQIRVKLDNFFNMAYVSAGFLLIAFLGSIASSIQSSLALRKK